MLMQLRLELKDKKEDERLKREKVRLQQQLERHRTAPHSRRIHQTTLQLG